MIFSKLAKLEIVAFSDPERKKLAYGSELRSTFEVMFNPESFSLEYASKFQDAEALGASTKPARFVRSDPKTLSLKLVFDGTDVNILPVEQLWTSVQTVSKRVKDFIDNCFYLTSETHEPNYLRVQWGEGPLQNGFDCRLQSAKVNYTSFFRSGAPRRAEIDAVFVEDLHPPKASAQDRLNSPDLTHHRVVRAGDTLPQMCAMIYGSAHYYLRVAEFNGIDDFRVLVPGTELSFPPLDKAGKGAGGSSEGNG
ncbi:hypothetical protein G6O69_36005 [Pseudenhygromyxa sp. WMMC2535]|uniref:CIS tube protein n=1 Tax=Pseudenhygromyxa sp. WMMC2535 TaxID=2712867 RepID=UPI001555C2CA|nr:hypothetical protein [Pseudenhygromyxa sp. WMMC2535]NVB43285.1 hypothetical protein [Pseudenhygromyxa sp. WMMC2535]